MVVKRDEKMRMIIDCDPGVDDAMALMMALAYPEKVQVVAVTSVFGNGQEDVTSTNILRVLTVCEQLDIPVYRGSATTMLGELATLDGYYGDDALGDVDDYPPEVEAQDGEDAVSALLRLANEQPGELTLVAIGPLTNVAQALRKDPDFGAKLKEVFIMGGNSDGRGNVTTSAEFNFYNDPEAAHIVLNKLDAPITLVPLDLCERYDFNWHWYEKFTAMPTKKAEFIKAVEALTVRRTKKENRKYHCYDQYACAAAINPSLVKETSCVYVTVELKGTYTRGQCVVYWKQKEEDEHYREPNVNLVTAVKKKKFKQMLEFAVGKEIRCFDHSGCDEDGEEASA